MLQEVRTKGNWNDWINFFLRGLIEVCETSILTAKKLSALVATDKEKINKSSNASNLNLIFEFFAKKPIATTEEITRGLEIEYRTVLRNVVKLEKLGIIKEISGRERNKIFLYEEYMNILNDDES